jgi:HAD superfamily hydrolase (TIGR01509 family)
MTFSAVIFDMDGVLVDSEPLHLRTTNEVLARRGAHLDDATYATFIGMTELAFFGQLVELLGLSEAPADLARERVALSLQAMSRDPLPPNVGALECLLALQADGRQLALASSATRLQVDLVTGMLGLRRVLSATVAAEDVQAGKPAPDLFLEAARRLEVEPESCLVVEDAVLGVEAAVAAGMGAVALPPRGDGGEAHLAAGALMVIRSLTLLTPDRVEQLAARRDNSP